ncbi:Sulfotransferase [Rhynchospora pubera]|uniref:Sulfotransferase n=1 Tax=Rhynchospora pubera TaxID=906938 RepID=A0AAV8CMH6_9POAL|nr:Sulfotransferase [Rhynchospora pubera]
MTAYSGKNSKWLQLPLRPLLVPFITLFSLLVCYTCMNQISLESKTVTRSILPVGTNRLIENVCSTSAIPPEEMGYIHFPEPQTYNRGECACTPVRYFVILSMQRSGSGWFETLLNSHPNISSNGEIFSIPQRRGNLSIIFNTLDTVYNLDWFSSAAKNECTAAYGLKWMLNQGVSRYQKEILSYFKAKGVSVIFLFRRNLLRRLISVLANDYDRQAKQLNGTHKAHVHSREEAEILAKFKPKLRTSSLIPNLQFMERTIAESLHNFSSIRHMVLYYEDIINNHKELKKVQEFLKVPVRELASRHVKIHTRPLPQQVENWGEVQETLNGTEYAQFLNYNDYHS